MYPHWLNSTCFYFQLLSLTQPDTFCLKQDPVYQWWCWRQRKREGASRRSLWEVWPWPGWTHCTALHRTDNCHPHLPEHHRAHHQLPKQNKAGEAPSLWEPVAGCRIFHWSRCCDWGRFPSGGDDPNRVIQVSLSPGCRGSQSAAGLASFSPKSDPRLLPRFLRKPERGAVLRHQGLLLLEALVLT